MYISYSLPVALSHFLLDLFAHNGREICACLMSLGQRLNGKQWKHMWGHLSLPHLSVLSYDALQKQQSCIHYDSRVFNRLKLVPQRRMWRSAWMWSRTTGRGCMFGLKAFNVLISAYVLCSHAAWLHHDSVGEHVAAATISARSYHQRPVSPDYFSHRSPTLPGGVGREPEMVWDASRLPSRLNM